MADPSTDVELTRRLGFAHFARIAWPHVVAQKLVWGPHMQLVCDHYAAVSRGEIKRLVVNVPPSTSKTTLTCVLWPAWDWTENPTRSWMFLSYSDERTLKSAELAMRLVSSDWYQERWGHITGNVLGGSRASRGLFELEKGGKSFATTIQSTGTGFHADIQVCDDPNKAQDLQLGGDSAREKMLLPVNAWNGTFNTRYNDPTDFRRVVIMQRLHEDDLAGSCIRQGYQHLCLPLEFEPDHAYDSPWGSDWRTVEGESLHPERFTPEVIAERKAEMTPIDYAAQMQQRPSPAAGVIFSLDHFEKRWDVRPPTLGRVILSVDATFKQTKTSDFCVIQAWGQKSGADFYLLDQWRQRTGLVGTIEAILELRQRWRATTVIVEEKANGPAVIDALKDRIPGVVPINPMGGKDARAWSVEPILRAGNVTFPSDRVAPWMAGLVANSVGFPNARYDDEVDAMTQALRYLSGANRKSRWRGSIAGFDRLSNALDGGFGF